MPPKKKYRISHRKSTDDIIVLKAVNSWNDEVTLRLDCGTDTLNTAQQNLYSKSLQEEAALKTKLDQITKQAGSELIYKGETCTAYQLQGVNQTPVAQLNTQQAAGMLIQKGPSNSNTYQLVMDPRLGSFIVGTMSSAPPPAQAPPKALLPPPPPPVQTQTSRAPVVKERRRGRPTNASILSSAAKFVVRPTEGTAVGGLTTGSLTASKSNALGHAQVVDLTNDDRPIADSREISFNKLQGKTFPSLVVVARPHLRAKESPSVDRSKLDGKVKGVLMHIPTKFTEWLIQQGLVRSEQTCSQHSGTKLKLGMYSDVSKFPYSGGYVWISECCPQRFVSVFSGSLFEGSPHPPSVLLKLVYHWSCQTNVQNVIQWVKIDNLYVKGLNTWLRAVCTVALHTHVAPLGGPGRRVEVGVISLGTTSQDGHQRQVKVEVLGLLETEAKLLRLRAVEPLADGDRNYKRRFTKILEPLLLWVHPDSIIVTDLTVDKTTLHQMGFANVVQNASSDHGYSNHTIMEYLRRIVPRMFQNTLSLLSRQIIQQFLDELVWREWFGVTAAQAFDNIIVHVAEQTRFDSGQTLIGRLYKVSTNPFKYWGLGPQNVPLRNSNKSTASINLPAVNNKVAAAATTLLPALPVIVDVVSTSTAKSSPSATPTPTPGPSTPQVAMPKRTTRKRAAAPTYNRDFTPSPEPIAPKLIKITPDVVEQTVPLDNYYYGIIDGRDTSNDKLTLNLKCSSCKQHFTDNIKLMDHLLAHAHNVTGSINQCRYCLASVATSEGLSRHILDSHPCETRAGGGFVCVLCELKFPKSNNLGKHMAREHACGELPYQCGGCGFRCSSHRHAIDHFYNQHKGEALLQCPFCLKTTSVFNGGRMMSQQTNFYLQHLQKHQKKNMAKKCTKCALWFVQKDVLKEHLVKMHTSVKGKVGFVPWKQPRDGVMVPKNKKTGQHHQQQQQQQQLLQPINRESSAEDVVQSNVRFDVALMNGAACLECGLNITPEHFQAHESCFKCQYSTLCKPAMNTHLSSCAREINTVVPPLPLAKVMHCVCGYKSKDGNQLAKHLTQCERRSAYPSEEAAKAATVTHSMLDVLGLVRRPEERPHPPHVESVEKDVLKLEEEEEETDEVVAVD